MTIDVLQMERDSIRDFLNSASVHVRGDVLDYGCGKQPYRELIEGHGGRYTGYDRAGYPSNVSEEDIGPPLPLGRAEWDTIVCTQILQYVPFPQRLMHMFADALRPGGALVITGPTNWREVEPADLHRFTMRGAVRLATTAGFSVEYCESRAHLDVAPGFTLSLGWGMVATV